MTFIPDQVVVSGAIDYLPADEGDSLLPRQDVALPPLSQADHDVLGAVLRANVALQHYRADVAGQFVTEAVSFARVAQREGQLAPATAVALEKLLQTPLLDAAVFVDID